MNAVETRAISIVKQYEKVMDEIEKAADLGLNSINICWVNLLYPEVALVLATEGYDVKIVIRNDESKSTNEISWEYAEEGKVGVFTCECEEKIDVTEETDTMMNQVLSKCKYIEDVYKRTTTTDYKSTLSDLLNEIFGE